MEGELGGSWEERRLQTRVIGGFEKECDGGEDVVGGKGGVMEICGSDGAEASSVDEFGGRLKKEVDSKGEYDGLVEGL